MPLTLHAITLADGARDEAVDEKGGPSDSTRIAFRELAAVVSEQTAFAAGEPTPESITSHRRIVDAEFQHGAVLPAPVGVVFRSPDVLTRWMELHYVSLTTALEYVEERCVARVHVASGDEKGGHTEPDADLVAQAEESVRAIRRRAVASIALRSEHKHGLPLGAAFLIEREHWKDFAASVSEQQDAHHLLRFSVTGPWAPYDFIRMVFGG